MLFCVVKSYEKDNKTKFFPVSILSAETYTEAYAQFVSMHFYNAGSYRLFKIRSRDFKTDVCSCYSLGDFDITTCLYTRFFKWDNKGNYVHESFYGHMPGVTDGDPELFFCSILSGKGLPESGDLIPQASFVVPPEVF